MNLTLPMIKVCGITSVHDAQHAVACGATAIGLNLWPQSPRYVDVQHAQEIAQAVHTQCNVVLVMVQASKQNIETARQHMPFAFMQFHDQTLSLDVEHAITTQKERCFQALGLAHEHDLEQAYQAPGSLILVDAKDDVLKGGTGQRIQASLAHQICAHRPTLLAGGMDASNVYEAILHYQPAGVDACSRLESKPGIKNVEQVLRYVQQARAAFECLQKSNQGLFHV